MVAETRAKGYDISALTISSPFGKLRWRLCKITWRGQGMSFPKTESSLRWVALTEKRAFLSPKEDMKSCAPCGQPYPLYTLIGGSDTWKNHNPYSLAYYESMFLSQFKGGRKKKERVKWEITEEAACCWHSLKFRYTPTMSPLRTT